MAGIVWWSAAYTERVDHDYAAEKMGLDKLPQSRSAVPGRHTGIPRLLLRLMGLSGRRMGAVFGPLCRAATYAGLPGHRQKRAEPDGVCQHGNQLKTATLCKMCRVR
jgi:hypothetical protein